VFFFSQFIFFYCFQIQLHFLILDLFGNDFHNFFILFFIRLLQSYDLHCKFQELTRLILVFFLIDFFPQFYHLELSCLKIKFCDLFRFFTRLSPIHELVNSLAG